MFSQVFYNRFLNEERTPFAHYKIHPLFVHEKNYVWNRKRISLQEAYEKFEAAENQRTKEYKNTRCLVCKNLGHPTALCPLVPLTKREKRWCATKEELLLHDFIENTEQAEYRQAPVCDQKRVQYFLDDFLPTYFEAKKRIQKKLMNTVGKENWESWKKMHCEMFSRTLTKVVELLAVGLDKEVILNLIFGFRDVVRLPYEPIEVTNTKVTDEE